MIAIKDFKMPENCLKCPMQFGGWCYVSPSDVDERVAPTVDEAWEQGKPDWCPLVDVPDEAGNCSEIPNSSESVSRRAVLDALEGEITVTGIKNALAVKEYADLALDRIKRLPSVQTEQRYTEEELRVFQHGISLSLLSKRSAQHWKYDEDTATEIKFLERLYEKVGADMRGERDSFCSYAERKTNGSDGDK